MATRVPLDGPDAVTTTAEIRKLSDLLEVSQTLSSTLNLKSALAKVLEILKERHGLLSGSVALLDDDNQLAIEVAAGLSWQATGRVRYRVGEGITGRVVQTGKPVVVPRASHEPLFLDRTGVLKGAGKGEISFVCVPITVDDVAVGALGVTLPYDKDERFEREVKFFGVAASMIGHAIRVQRLLETERKGLVQENRQLRQELKERYDFRNIVGNSR